MNDDLWVYQAALITCFIILPPFWWWNNIRLSWETATGTWKKDFRQFFFYFTERKTDVV